MMVVGDVLSTVGSESLVRERCTLGLSVRPDAREVQEDRAVLRLVNDGSNRA